MSTAGRSLPEFLLRSHPRVRIVNEGAPCVRMGPDDQPISEHPERRRSCTTARRGWWRMSTIPYWGFGARIFPFADERDDRFSLRVCDVGLARGGDATSRSIWRGSYRNDRTVHDFLCERIAIHYDESDGSPDRRRCGRSTYAGARRAGRSPSRWSTITHRRPVCAD